LVRLFHAGRHEGNPYRILVPPKVSDWSFLGKRYWPISSKAFKDSSERGMM